MKTHILPGDALLEAFQATKIDGEVLVARECLIEGPVLSRDLNELWQLRARYLLSEYGVAERRYYQDVAGEYEKIFRLAPEDEIYLWFEYDLFCHINMWFVLSLLGGTIRESVYRIEPVVRKGHDLWKGFGDLSKDDLKQCYERRLKMSQSDLLFGAELWTAYRNRDLKKLSELSTLESPGFPRLREACEAEIDWKMNRRPEKTIQRLMDEGLTDFKMIFRRFSEKEGVYGFGDLQVETMYRRIQSAAK